VRLEVIDLEGNVLLQVENASSGRPAVWSPDSTRVVVDRAAGLAETETVVFDLNGELVAQLPPLEEVNWSDDGSRLAFLRMVPEQFGLNPPGVGGWFDLETGELHLLEPVGNASMAYHEGAPRWQPGGDHVLGFKEQLVNVDTGELESLPGTLVSWSHDGRFALLANDETPGD
jgi:hypothetical protein